MLDWKRRRSLEPVDEIDHVVEPAAGTGWMQLPARAMARCVLPVRVLELEVVEVLGERQLGKSLISAVSRSPMMRCGLCWLTTVASRRRRQLRSCIVLNRQIPQSSQGYRG
jgi:hypothetical protein